MTVLLLAALITHRRTHDAFPAAVPALAAFAVAAVYQVVAYTA